MNSLDHQRDDLYRELGVEPRDYSDVTWVMIGEKAIGGLKDGNYICGMFVDIDHRGQGLGEQVLGLLHKIADGDTYLDTHEDMTAARGLYKKYGYREVNKWGSLIRMRRSVKHQSSTKT